jgi:transcription elongation factor GreA
MKPNQKVQLTLEAFNELQTELDDLKNNKIAEVTDRVAKAREFGDISENSEYDSAQEELAWVHGRIEELSDILNRAQIVQATTSKSEVGVGSIVHVEINGATHEFTIVGEWEADPAAKKISQESPLGKALLGKKINESVEVEAPAGKIVYRIKAIK